MTASILFIASFSTEIGAIGPTRETTCERTAAYKMALNITNKHLIFYCRNSTACDASTGFVDALLSFVVQKYFTPTLDLPKHRVHP